jgi:PAS domain S-box-containing protein
LRESEAHYRAVAEAATDAIITMDSDSTTLIVNPNAAVAAALL